MVFWVLRFDVNFHQDKEKCFCFYEKCWRKKHVIGDTVNEYDVIYLDLEDDSFPLKGCYPPFLPLKQHANFDKYFSSDLVNFQNY